MNDASKWRFFWGEDLFLVFVNRHWRKRWLPTLLIRSMCSIFEVGEYEIKCTSWILGISTVFLNLGRSSAIHFVHIPLSVPLFATKMIFSHFIPSRSKKKKTISLLFAKRFRSKFVFGKQPSERSIPRKVDLLFASAIYAISGLFPIWTAQNGRSVGRTVCKRKVGGTRQSLSGIVTFERTLSMRCSSMLSRVNLLTSLTHMLSWENKWWFRIWADSNATTQVLSEKKHSGAMGKFECLLLFAHCGTNGLRKV